MTFEQEIIKGTLIFLATLISIGVIYKIFFKQKIVIIEPTPKKVVVHRR